MNTGDTGTVTELPKPIKVGISGGNMDTSQIKTKYMNVSYAKVSNTQKLDIYIPNDISGHNHGYAVVSVNYRLSTEARFPAAVNDCQAAVHFVKANAAKYDFDPDRIAAWGSSSGGIPVFSFPGVMKSIFFKEPVYS